MSLTYKDSGVDIEKGDALVDKIKQKVKSTYGKRVVSGVGGFASLYEMGDKLLAAGTDGVGTKLKLAKILNKHDTIGIDLVAMCVNDILCTGAKPIFFMDYLATSQIDMDVSQNIIDGIVQGCKESDMALIGGETAEMPGFYSPGEYDLAGFCVGEVLKDEVLDGRNIQEDDRIVGVASKGFHSNGYSLIRRLVNEDEIELLEKCLIPTRIYSQAVQTLLKNEREQIKGFAHITGGGFLNISRLSKEFDYHVEKLPPKEDIPSFIFEVSKRANLNLNELYRTFNMGVGLVILTNNSDMTLQKLKELGLLGWDMGIVKKGKGDVYINGEVL